MDKRKKQIAAVIVSVLLIAAVGVFAALGARHGASASEEENPYMHSVGDLYKEASENPSSTVVARYHDIEITEDTVEYYQKARAQSTLTEVAPTKREIAESLIRNTILLEEAKARGLAATEEEIEGELETVRSNYEKYEYARETIDAFCDGAGITFEEYMEGLREQQPNHIARVKLSWQIAQEWCDEHGVEYSRSQPPEGMQEAVEAELDRIVAAHMGEAVFFVD